jgi:sugar lactone lactonase YvrE
MGRDRGVMRQRTRTDRVIWLSAVALIGALLGAACSGSNGPNAAAPTVPETTQTAEETPASCGAEEYGVITTIAGDDFGSDGEGIPATDAQTVYPHVVGFDRQGNLYITDGGGEAGRVRKIDRSGVITTIVGVPAGGQATTVGEAGSVVGEARAIDAQGNLYIATEGGAKVVKVTPSGEVSTVAGTGVPGYSGDGGPAAQAQLGELYGAAAVDAEGNFYFADLANNRVRRVDTKGMITTVAGTGEAGYSGDGGPATEAQLNGPTAVSADREGNVYVADSENHRFRRIDGKGLITTVAGNGKAGFSGDGGPATKTRVGGEGVWVDADGNLYLIGDRIRKVDTRGIITTVAGNGVAGYSGDGGSATEAQLSEPTTAVIGPNGALYIGDSGNGRIRKVCL